MNKVILIGRTTKQVETRSTSTGKQVATFTIAVDRNFKNQAGEKETDFFNVVCWRGLAETVEKYLGKGRLIAVSGRLQNRNYEAKDGTKRYITEIIASEVQFLERAKDGQAQEPQPPSGFTLVDDPDALPF